MVDSKTQGSETIHFTAAASPETTGQTLTVTPADDEALDSLSLTRPSWIKTQDRDVRVEIMKRHLATPASTGTVKSAPTNIFNPDGTFNVGATWARRHVLSSYDMRAHYEQALIKPHKTVKTAGEALAGRGNAPASKDKAAIQPAAQALLTRFHNEAENIWVGDTRENSRLQENIDAAPAMYETTGQLRVTSLEAHIQNMANNYGIPGPVPLTVSNRENVPIRVTYTVVG
jgi:hypothetical protein